MKTGGAENDVKGAFDIEMLKENLANRREQTLARISSSFQFVVEHEFDDFLYDFDEELAGGVVGQLNCAVLAVEPDMQEIYGFDPRYTGTFNRQRYIDFIERSLGDSLADRFALVCKSVLWVGLDGEFIAFGSRATERVFCWSCRVGKR
ncbi:hypothetical protein GCM10028862_02690 [Luteimonas pelagia]